MRKVRALRRGAGILLTVLLGALLAANLYTIGAKHIAGKNHPTVFGWSTAVVISGSMSPEIEVNDMILIHGQKSYRPGDVITFHSGNSVVTHRVVELTPDGYVTKGDANNAPDAEPVFGEQIIGRVVLVLPGVGGAIAFLQTPLGMLCLVVAGIALIEVPYIINHTKTKRREKEAAK